MQRPQVTRARAAPRKRCRGEPASRSARVRPTRAVSAHAASRRDAPSSGASTRANSAGPPIPVAVAMPVAIASPTAKAP